MLRVSDFEKVGRVLADKYGIRVVCAGQQCCTDGNIIVLPNIPEELASQRLLGLVRSYLDHEVGHIVGKSDMPLLGEIQKTKGPVFESLFQSAEDIRIEQVMADLWAGCGLNLDIGGKEILADFDHQVRHGGPRQDELKNNPLKQLSIAMHCVGKGFKMPDWIDPKVAALAEKHREQLAEIPIWASKTSDLVPLVEELTKEYGELRRPPQPEPKPGDGEVLIVVKGKGKGKGGASSEPVGKVVKLDDEPDTEPDGAGSDDESEKSKPEPSGGGSQGSKDDEDEDEDTSDDEGAAGEGDADEDPDEDDVPAEVSDAGPDDGADEEPDEDQPGTGGEQGGTAKAPEELNQTPTPQEIACEPVMESLAKVAQQVLTEAVNQAMQAGTDGADLYRFQWNDKVARIQEASKNAGDTSPFQRRVEKAGGPLRGRLRQMLQTESKTWWQGGKRRGRPDPSKIAALALGTTPFVMRRRHEMMAKDTAVYLLIDGSGSMQGTKCHEAVTAAGAFAQTLDLCGHACEVAMFFDDGGWIGFDGSDPDAEKISALTNGANRHSVRLLRAKKWRESFRASVCKFVSVLAASNSGTPTGDAIFAAGQQMMHRPEKRKVIFVFTDGEPNDHRKVQVAVKKCEQWGIEVVTLGFGRGISLERLREDCPKSVLLRDADGLAGESMRLLAQCLMPHRDHVEA